MLSLREKGPALSGAIRRHPDPARKGHAVVKRAPPYSPMYICRAPYIRPQRAAEDETAPAGEAVRAVALFRYNLLVLACKIVI